MSRKREPTKTKTKADVVRELPWAAMLQTGLIAGRRWRALSAKDRARLSALVRESGGRLSNLSLKQRVELKRLAGKIDLRAGVREVAILARVEARRRRRRRR